MKTTTILNTTNYNLFVSNEYQQPTSEAHIERLSASISKHGYRQSKPIQVYRRADGKLVIVDGHHRFGSCKALGLPILYVIEDESAQDAIGDENAVVKKWPNSAFVSMYAAKGNEDYRLLQYYNKNGIVLKQCASMLRGESAGSCNAGAVIRTGQFKVKTRKQCNALLELIGYTGNREFLKRAYVEALSLAMLIGDAFNMNLFAEKSKKNPMLIKPCATREQALEVIEDVYNRNTREKVNIAFLATQSAIDRRSDFGRSTK